jgi:hypothetical protein
MKGNDHEERKILEHIPGDGRVAMVPALDFKGGHQKPGPVQKYIDTRKTEEANRSLARAEHNAQCTALGRGDGVREG